jgi:hypothetical protein
LLRFLYCSKGKPEPDTLILNDGEKLIGHLVRSKIQEPYSTSRYAVIQKDVKPNPKAGAPNVPERSISEAEQKIAVASDAGTKSGDRATGIDD